MQAWDQDGSRLIDEVGELVITEPMPSMPIYLWGDEDGSRLRDSLLRHVPGLWRHGDWIEITSRGTAIIYGRSDSTINRGGVRMGTAEIYRAVLSVPEVLDALVVDLPREGTDGWMPLFVVLARGTVADRRSGRDDPPAGARGLLAAPRAQRDPPDRRGPRTLSGKVLEVPVKRILTGTPPDRPPSRESLANPAALDYFVALADEYAG